MSQDLSRVIPVNELSKVKRPGCSLAPGEQGRPRPRRSRHPPRVVDDRELHVAPRALEALDLLLEVELDERVPRSPRNGRWAAVRERPVKDIDLPELVERLPLIHARSVSLLGLARLLLGHEGRDDDVALAAHRLQDDAVLAEQARSHEVADVSVDVGVTLPHRPGDGLAAASFRVSARRRSFASWPRVPTALQDHDRQAARTPRARVNSSRKAYRTPNWNCRGGPGSSGRWGRPEGRSGSGCSGSRCCCSRKVRVVEEVEDEGAHLQPLALAQGQGIDGGEVEGVRPGQAVAVPGRRAAVELPT